MKDLRSALKSKEMDNRGNRRDIERGREMSGSKIDRYKTDYWKRHLEITGPFVLQKSGLELGLAQEIGLSLG